MKFTAVCVVLVVTSCLLADSEAQRRGNKKRNRDPDLKLKPFQVKKMLREMVDEIQDVVEKMVDNCLTEYPGDKDNTLAAMKSARDVLTFLNKQLPSEIRKCKKQRPMARPTPSPCDNHLKLGFREFWDEINGDRYYNISILNNRSMETCDPAQVWLNLTDITNGIGGNETEIDYEGLLSMCPPSPECAPHFTRFWSPNDTLFENGDRREVLLYSNYGSVNNCSTNHNNYELRLEFQSCPRDDDPYATVVRLPGGCRGNNFCETTPWESTGGRGDKK